jgi:hypothetical protein
VSPDPPRIPRKVLIVSGTHKDTSMFTSEELTVIYEILDSHKNYVDDVELEVLIREILNKIHYDLTP